MAKRFKDYSELTFTDDFMFCKVMSTNLDLCKEVLELILNMNISRIELVESQKTFDITALAKSIRLDVYVSDDSNTVYDVEMQTTLATDLPKRTRYYQGMIDLNLIEKGSPYKELKKTYIIFICLENPFKESGKNLPIYTFENICLQDNEIKLKDDAYKVIINAAGDRDNLSDNMCAFLDYLQGKDAESKLTKAIETSVDKAIERSDWRVEYMTLNAKIMEERAEAREEGREVGREEGREEECIKNIRKTISLLRRLNFKNEDIIREISQTFEISLETAGKYIEDYYNELSKNN